MLYNESTGKTDLFSVKSLVKWLETKPATDTYSYIDGGNCLIAQYLQAKGFSEARVGPKSYCLKVGGSRGQLPTEFHDIALGQFNGFWTRHSFGDALRRAKEYL